MPMPTRLPPNDGPHTGPPPQFAGARLVRRIRLLLGARFGLACMAVSVCVQSRLPWPRGGLLHRFDAVAAFVIVVIVAIGGHVDSLPFLPFLPFTFSLLAVAFSRWGRRESARVVVASGVLYCGGALAAMPAAAPPQLPLSTAAVLLALGYAIVLIGQRNLRAHRRLALLRDLNQACNPRFGVDRSLTVALENTRAFFGAERCIVLLEECETGQFFCRCVSAGGPLTVPADPVDAVLAHALLPFPRTHVLLYRATWRRWRLLAPTSLSHAGQPSRWSRFEGAHLAELLEADCFISAPLVLGCGKGRIYVTSGRRPPSRADALFLAQIAAQGLRVIDRIDLLDRIASDAAKLARKKFALDLHDSAIQPYVGLRLALAALRRRAEPDNPLIDELDKVLAVADGVITQLRDVARGVGLDPGTQVPLCLSALQLQSEQAMATYGVDIRIHIEGRVGFGDRLTAEVLHIVREGMSNICRHTQAKRGAVWLRCSERSLCIEIGNENSGHPAPAFLPRSIIARATALGGIAAVRPGPLGSTLVCVEIPV